MSFPILPLQKEVYEALTGGRHVCVEDRAIYEALRDREDDFKQLFKGLGMTLVGDPRGFYYLEGSRTPASMKDILFFVAIFLEYLDETGFAIDEVIQGGLLFYFKDMPHLKHQRYAEVMERATGVKTEDGLRGIVASMARYRFVVNEGDGFRFRVAAFRLHDLVLDAKNAMERVKDEMDKAEEASR